MNLIFTNQAKAHISAKIDELSKISGNNEFAIGIYTAIIRSWGKKYLTVEVDFNLNSRFQGEFKQISSYNGFPVLIDPKAEELLNTDQITIDEGGWYLFKKLIIHNTPIISQNEPGYCRI